MIKTYITSGIFGLLFSVAPLTAQLPELPAGLDFDQLSTPEPSLQDYEKSNSDWRDSLPFSVNGFWDIRAGNRLKEDPNQAQMSIAESRLHLNTDLPVNGVQSTMALDLVYDPLYKDDVNFTTGGGWIDLREAFIFFSPMPAVDIKFGRQILTWGTGDLVFLNDLFPKDWNSFFLGRDVAYLKAPSDSLKLSWFNPIANIDFVYTPQFDPDRSVDNAKLSFFSPAAGQLVGSNDNLNTDLGQEFFQDDEFAARIYRLIGSVELAAYLYNGYWKSPNSVSDSGVLTFSSLAVYGASIRSPILNGVGYSEVAFYDSQADPNGNDPRIANSQLRFLLGYEQELIPNVTGGVQYYIEHIQDYGNYISGFSDARYATKEDRHIITQRVTILLEQETWILSAFNFYCFSDQDGYFRSNITHKVNDSLSIQGGLNVFYGLHESTFFGQFHTNNNLYTAVTVGF